ncbi:hypothetical protein TNIN_476241 [Trichonephila inaurata madagascariensis]|uniref:Uncharacterized protein n=1 Tax=Trichonephila inaurata madagascariensis TaxID=2747483 RepID=A0A8X6IPV9_9ARAC|nr:hypothetical protein TNIN_476241 [Trichonephila inaurata madagascariensis]
MPTVIYRPCMPNKHLAGIFQPNRSEPFHFLRRNIVLPFSFRPKSLLVRPVVSTSKDSGTIPGHFKPGALQHGIACKRTGPQLHLSLSLSLPLLLLAHSFHLHPTSFLSFAPPHPVSLLFLLPLTASVRCGCHAGDNHRQGGEWKEGWSGV